MTRFAWEHVDGQLVDVFVVADAVRRAVTRADTEAAARVMVEDFEYVDHRKLVGDGEAGPDHAMEIVDEQMNMGWSESILPIDYPVITPQGLVARAVTLENVEGGGQFEELTTAGAEPGR